MKTRDWRLAIWASRELVPLRGRIAWEEKRLILKAPGFPFAMKGRYKAVFADPSYPYTLLRVYLRPLRLEKDAEKKTITEIEFEYFHRKEPCDD